MLYLISSQVTAMLVRPPGDTHAAQIITVDQSSSKVCRALQALCC